MNFIIGFRYFIFPNITLRFSISISLIHPIKGFCRSTYKYILAYRPLWLIESDSIVNVEFDATVVVGLNQVLLPIEPIPETISVM